VRCAWRNRGRFIGYAPCETLLRPRRPGASEQRSVDRESHDSVRSDCVAYAVSFVVDCRTSEHGTAIENPTRAAPSKPSRATKLGAGLSMRVPGWPVSTHARPPPTRRGHPWLAANSPGSPHEAAQPRATTPFGTGFLNRWPDVRVVSGAPWFRKVLRLVERG
jgi:hypothetical protein